MKKRYILVAIVLVLAVVVAVVFRWASQPVTTQKSTTLVNQPSASTAPTQAPKSLDSKYYSSVLPAGMVIRFDKTTPQGSILSQTMALSSSARSGDQLSITIGTAPSGGLNELADVKIRRTAPASYLSDTSTTLPKGAIGFIKQDSSYEHDVFWPHNGKYAAIAVTGTVDRKAELNAILEQVINKWQWR